MNSVPHSKSVRTVWLLPLGTLFFACGIASGRSIAAWQIFLAALMLALPAALLGKRCLRLAGAMTVILTIGGLLGWHAFHPVLPDEGEYLVRGTVHQEITLQTNGRLQCTLTDVTLNGASWGNAYWTCYPEEDAVLPVWLVPGAQLEMTARVYHPSERDNPGNYSFRDTLLQQGIRIGLYSSGMPEPADGPLSLSGHFAGLRYKLSQQLKKVMGSEAGACASAMLLGTRSAMPEDDLAAFTALGIAHILSISGFHVGVLAGLMHLLLRPIPLGRKSRLALESLLLFSYCLLTGGRAPVIRATLLLLWRDCSRVRHKQILPLHLLCTCALLQLVFSPTQLTSPAFQLTYSAMLGLLLVFPRLRKRRIFRRRLATKLWDAFCAALSVQLGILFPQLYWFGELPLVSILLNTVVMALMTGLMLLYWCTLAAAFIPGLGALLGHAAGAATLLLLQAIRSLAALELTTLWTRQADFFTFLGWVLLLAGACVLLPRRLDRYRPRLLIAGGLLTALLLLPLPESSTTYTQFSVGNADAALLQDREMTVVIDAGENGTALASRLHQQRQRVEALIISHLHIDHAGGIRELLEQKIPVDICYLPSAATTPVIDEEVLPLLEALANRGTTFRFLQRGDLISLPSGQLTVLWPEEGRVYTLHDANDVCLVLQADIAGVTMLLTGDLSGAYGKYTSLPSDVLKLPHHGSPDANREELLALVQPQLLLLSNRNEHRERHIRELAGNIPLYITDRCGAVTIRFTGNGQFTVQTVK